MGQRENGVSSPAEQVIETARNMNRNGLNSGTSGNVSVRTADGMLITPSSRDYEQLTSADIVAMGHDATWTAENDCRPSSEWRFHLGLYAARPDLQAIVHAHPVNATALAVHSRGIGPFHYMVGVAGGHNIRCAPYATFGTEELSEHVVAAMVDRKACLMSHHGLLAAGDTTESALALAVEVETLAAQLIAALAIGEPPELSTAQMDAVLAKMASPDGYGSSPETV